MSKPKNKPPKVSRVYRLDSIRLDETFFTTEGYLVDTPIVTSVGIFEYTNPDGSIRRELRLPEHVFEEDSLNTYEGKPVIITHDASWVTEKNVEDEIVGTILSPGYQDGDDVRAKIIIHSIAEVEKSGLRELSLGYRLLLDETPGEWNGQPYDAIQTEIRVNHLALVGEARAGGQARLNLDGDKTKPLKGGKSMAKPKTKALSVEELTKRLDARRKKRLDEGAVEVVVVEPDEDRADIDIPGGDEEPAGSGGELTLEEKIKYILDRRDRRDEGSSPDTLEKALEYLVALDEDLDDLLKIIEELQAGADFAETADEGEEPAVAEDAETLEEETALLIKLDGKDKEAVTASIDRIVRERTKLLRIGDRLNLDGLEDMSPKQMKVAIINAVNPRMRLDGKGDGYINAAFDLAVDTLQSEKSTDRQRRSMSQHKRADSDDDASGKSLADAAREAMNERLMNGGDE